MVVLTGYCMLNKYFLGADSAWIIHAILKFSYLFIWISQCLQHRALNPDDPLPPLSEVIASYLKLPKVIEVQCQATVDKMKEKFKLEMVAKEKKDETADNLFQTK